MTYNLIISAKTIVDFYEYSTIGLPLTFITDDLLMSMAGSQKNYFILNRHNALDQRDHYFIFK
ncbi:DUF5960 family protein, partial [Fundicoccus ignavus]